MAMPVVPARLLIDELDRLGIRVQIIEALWQSAAAAWDPSSSLGGSNSERVVAESLPTAASILFDPAGRLVWSWSRGGHLLAGGSMRILTERASEAAPDTIERGRTRLALVRGEDIARLGAEWLAWSLQLGVAPSRVVIVGEPSEGGLSAADLGRTISERWHDATIDFVREQDPVGATLARLADREPASQKGISELANRPGRAHKAMYRWTAAALFCGAGVLGVLAWRILASAGTFQDQAGTVSRSYAELCAEEGLALPTAIPDLDILIKQASKPAIDPSKVFPTVPVLQELEALSFVLGNDQLTLRELTINPISLTLKVEVAQTEMYEALSQSIRSVSGSTVEWRDTLNPRQTTVEATFSGSWPRSPGGQN